MRIRLISLGWARCGMQRHRFYRVPPLGLETLAGLTPPEHEVRIVDENAGQDPLACDADLVGISVLTAAAAHAYEIADSYRARGIPVVMGGHHPTLMPDEALGHADAVCVGEADDVWPAMVEDARHGTLQPIYRGGWHRFTAAPTFPRRDLVSPRAYMTRNTVETTRGCPNDCDFCSVTHFFGGRYRRKPIDFVVEELARLPDRRPVWFASDNFTGHPGYTKALLRRMKGLGLTWFCQSSLRIAEDRELLELMRDSGCKLILAGLESIDREGMASIAKSWMDPASYPEWIRGIRDHGIAVLATFMFGLDTHGPDVFKRTVEFCVDNGIDLPQFSILTPWPRTRLYARLRGEGRILHDDWSRYDGLHCVFQPARMTPDELKAGYHYACHECYSWSSILKRLAGLPPHPLIYLGLNLSFKACGLDRNDETGERVTRFEAQPMGPPSSGSPQGERAAPPAELPGVPDAEPLDSPATAGVP